MRKVVVSLLVGSLIVLAGCGGGAPAQQPATPAAQQQPAPAPAQPAPQPAAQQPAAPAAQPAPAAQQPAALPKVSGKVRFAYMASTSLGPLFHAASKYWPAMGIEVETIRQPSGSAILSQLATGQADIGAGALGATAFNAIYQKLPVAFVAPLHFERAEEYLIISNKWKEQGVNSVADLKGKPVAINAKGVVTEYVLEMALKHGNLGVKDIELKTMRFPDMVPALETGAIAGAILTQPFAAQAEMKNVGFLPLRDVPSEHVPFTVVFYNTDWASKNRDLANAVMLGYMQAVRDVVKLGKHEGEYLAALKQFTPVTEEVLQAYKPAHYDVNGEVDKAALMEQQQFNLDRGYLEYKELIPIDQIYNTTWLDAALKVLGKQ